MRGHGDEESALRNMLGARDLAIYLPSPMYYYIAPCKVSFLRLGLTKIYYCYYYYYYFIIIIIIIS